MSNAQKIYHYVVEVVGGIEPVLHGHVDTDAQQEALAKRVHAGNDPDTDAVLWMDVAIYGNGNATPVVQLGSYSGAFFGDEA